MLELLPEGPPAPVSDHLHEVLKDNLRYVLPQKHEYTRAFDTSEYLVGMLTTHEYEKIEGNGAFLLSFGDYRFLYRYTYPISDVRSNPISRQLEAEIGKSGGGWPLLRAGLFDGNLERHSAPLKTALTGRCYGAKKIPRQ